MKNIISFSGGLGSAVSAIIAYENGLDFELVFADTLIEDEDLYRFIEEISQVIKKPIHWLKDGRTPWEVFVDKKYIGNTRTAHCSAELKTLQVQNWLFDAGYIEEGVANTLYQLQPFRLILGMDYSELDRLERASENWKDYCSVGSLINEYKVWRPEWKVKFGKYGMGFPHNNCGGMCVRAGLKQFATLLELMPDRFDYHEKEQLKAMEAIGPTARPFLRKTINGKINYLTLKEFREKFQSGEIKIDPYDWGGCSCFVD